MFKRAVAICRALHRAASDWLYVVPWGMRRTLCWLKQRYSNPVVYVTENGFSDSAGTTDDHDRIDYLRRYINEVLKGWSTNGPQPTFLFLKSYPP